MNIIYDLQPHHDLIILMEKLGINTKSIVKGIWNISPDIGGSFHYSNKVSFIPSCIVMCFPCELSIE